MTIKEEKTESMYLCITKAANRSDYIVEVYIKEARCMWYAVLSYARIPSQTLIARDTYAYNSKSQRPYKAGQPCNGSTTSCVYHLYNQLCLTWGIDAVAFYNETYEDHSFTPDEFEDLLKFAEWQGVERIKRWSEKNIDLVFESMHEINLHLLADNLSKKIAV